MQNNSKWSKTTKRWLSWYISRYLHATLLRDMLDGKGVKQLKSFRIPRLGVMRAGEETIRVVQEF